MSRSFVQIDDVTKVFETSSGPIIALEGLSLSISRTEFVAIIGPSGCGKSTLLRLMAGLLQPTTGSLKVDNQSPEALRRARGYSFVFQDPVTLPWRTISENVELAMELVGVDQSSRRTRGLELIKLVGLSGFEDARPDQLSGGMRQRVALARALSLDPKLLLMDEPFGALDEITRAQMNAELMKILKEQNLTALLVTHSVEEAVFLSDRVAIMTPRPGKIDATIDIDLPRPRVRTIKESDEFFAHVSSIRKILESGSASEEVARS